MGVFSRWEKKDSIAIIPRNKYKKERKEKRKGKERKNKEKRKWCLGLLVIAMWISKEISPNCGD